MKQISLYLLTLLLVPSIFQIQASNINVTEEDAEERPSFEPLRFEEDWTDYRGDHGFPDPIKNIRFGPSGSLSLGGEVRFRGESWNNFAFGGPGASDDSYGLFRVRLHSDLWVNRHLRFFLEGKSVHATGRELPGGIRPSDADNIDFLNGFAQVRMNLGEARFSIMGGRQEFFYGRQRLVSPIDWSNSRRSFDGIRTRLEWSDWRLDGFWTKPVQIRKYELNRSRPSPRDFFGTYLTGSFHGTLDIYWLGLQDDSATWTGFRTSETRHTIGFRRVQQIRSFDYEMEGAYQFGNHGHRDISAVMFTGIGGVRPGGGPLRLYGAVEYASGDDNPQNDSLGTFNHLFPLGHGHLGHVDIVGRQNLIDLRLGGSLNLPAGWQFVTDWHNFWRATDQDGLYSPGGSLSRPALPGGPTGIGSNLDLYAVYRPAPLWRVRAGYSHFFPGDYIEATGSSEGIDWAYLEVQYLF